ncbi:MAG: metal-dependent hydrolase [Desulfovibrio sp.]|nr:metal-dependent hydrolase [Desulfovibrio sp.]
MKWITHQTAAVTLGVALHMPLAGLAALCGGAILPDVLDQRMARLAVTRGGRQRLFNAVHRGTTHWFGWWLTLCAVAFSGAGVNGSVKDVCLGLGLGGLSHVLLDMLTPSGVPLGPLRRRPALSLKICATGSLGELCLLVAMVAAAWLFLREDVLELARMFSRAAMF